MNEQMIEELLRKTPAPIAPSALKDDLIAGIRLRPTPARTSQLPQQGGWFARWFPTWSLAALALACVAVVAAQSYRLAELRRADENLRADIAKLPALREANKDAQRLRNENAELEIFRKNETELQRLRDESTRLRAQINDLPQLRAENERLNTAVATLAADRPDFFAHEKSAAERISCVNNLKIIGTAMRVFANENDGRFPKNFVELTNELSTWKILKCPGDSSRQISGWGDVISGNVSYKLSTDGLTEKDTPSIVVGECPVHHNILMLDGSVQQLSEAAMTNALTTDTNGRRIFKGFHQ